MKTYRYHYCESRHRSYDTIAKCLWPRAVWVAGYAYGGYASISRCRNRYEPSVMLHATAEEAFRAKDFIDALACGGSCCRDHEVVKILGPDEIESKPGRKRTGTRGRRISRAY